MSRIAISGSWRTVDAQVERDVRSAVASLYKAGHGIVSGGALGVDFIATEEALKHDPDCTRTLIIIPTPLSVYAAHYRKRAVEGVITSAQAEALIAQLTSVQRAHAGALIEMAFDVCNNLTYFARNSAVVEAADSLLAFQVNNSEGVGDTVAKAEARGLPVTCHRYTIAAPASAVLQSTFRAAREAAHMLALAPAAQRTQALQEMAAALHRHAPAILSANQSDMAAAANLAAPLRDRLLLTPERLEAVAMGVEAIAALPDPVGLVQTEWDRPNGLHIQRVSVPLGVIGIIYESRPNVTADAGALCVRSGNACILRGGSDSFQSSRAIHKALQEGLMKAGLPPECIQMVDSPDRALVGEMLFATGLIDVIIPRGGKSLVARVEAESRVPVFAHLEGINHMYVDADADEAMAVPVVLNAKLRRTSVCGAAETLLVDAASPLLAPLVQALLEAGCEVRGDNATQAVDGRVKPATEDDWRTEYLDAIISVKVVANVDAAIAHINHYSSHHTDSIVTCNAAHAEKFLREVDSAIVLHNASTQFADGGEFGFGAEIGIATGRLHARGPVGAAQLTTYKYVVKGSGQTRP